MAYLVDANVLIQAKNLHYGFDFCPAFWDWIVAEASTGNVVSVEKVGNELKAGADSLASWAVAQGSSFFLPPDPLVVSALAQVSTWAASMSYEGAAVNTFLGSADYYLVAHALAHGYAVATHEKASASLRRIKIPDACNGVGVPCTTPFEMLRKEGARFIL